MDKNTNNNNNNNNRHQGLVVVALIAAASLLSLGAVAATTITPAFAGGDDDDGDTKNMDELIIFNKDNKPLTQEELLQLLTEQPTKSQPTRTAEESSTVGTAGFSAPSLP
jgi:hypothetical protein